MSQNVLSVLESLSGSFVQQHWPVVAVIATVASLLSLILLLKARASNGAEVIHVAVAVVVTVTV